MNVALDQCPGLSPAARLRFDPQAQSYVLLSPERGLRLNASATEVVQRCTGTRTVQEIIDGLIDACSIDDDVSAAQLSEDVLELLSALSDRQLLVFEPAP